MNNKHRGRIHGHITLSGTKKSMSQETKDALVNRTDGKICQLRKVFIDPETNAEVMFEGDMRVSTNGNLTASFNVVVEDLEFILTEPFSASKKKEGVEKFDADKAGKELLGV